MLFLSSQKMSRVTWRVEIFILNIAESNNLISFRARLFLDKGIFSDKNEYTFDILEQICLRVSGRDGIKGPVFIFLAEHHAVAGHVAP